MLPRFARLLCAFAVCWLAGLAEVPSHASEGGETTLSSGPAVIKIKPVMMPVTTASGSLEKYTQMEVTVELTNSSMLQQAQAATPRLQAAILAEFYKAIEQGMIVRGAIVNSGALRKHLADACEDILGKGSVGRVLIAPSNRQSAWP